MLPHRELRTLSRRPTAQLAGGPESWRPSRRPTFEESGAGAYAPALATQDDNSSTLAALAVWRTEAEKLTPKQRALFLQNSEPRDFTAYVEALQTAIQRRADSGKIFGVARKVRPFYELAARLAPVAGVASEFSPVPITSILGGITSILSLSVRVDDYQTKMVEMLASMATELQILDRYRTEAFFVDDPDVQASQIDVATDVLKFCITAAKTFFDDDGKEKNGLLFALKTQWKDFNDKFGDIKTDFQRHIAELEKWRSLANSRRLRSVQQDVDAVGKSVERGQQEWRLRTDENQEADNRRAAEENRRHVMQWLPSIPFGKIQEDAYDRRVTGTGTWLIDHPDFQSWRKSPESALLWVHGKPGCGKSHLAARAIHDLSQPSEDEPTPAVAYVYCSSTQSAARLDLNILLGSILGQLYLQLPSNQELDSIATRAITGSKEGPRRSEMKEWILAACGKLRSPFIIIDGLDECSEFEDNQFADLCAFITTMVETNGLSLSVKVLVLSRPNYPAISQALRSYPQITVDSGANSGDITAYISQTVDEINPDPTPEETEGFADIKGLLLNNADGMFLWVRLKVKDFKEIGSVEDIKEALEDVAEGLDGLYTAAIRKIAGRPRFVRDRAFKALLWVANSYRSLSKLELIEALSMKPGRRGLNDSQRLSREMPLSTECADLLVEVGGRYQLIHASLRDFLLSQSTGHPTYDDLQLDAHATIAETCLTYLAFDEFRSGAPSTPKELVDLLSKYPLLDYASFYWGDHLSHVEGSRYEKIERLTVSILGVEPIIDMVIQILEFEEFGRGSFWLPGTPSPLHLLSILNLRKLALAIPNLERFVNAHDRLLHLPIDYALIYGAWEMCDWILDIYRRDVASSGDLFSTCLRCCQVDLLHGAVQLDWGEMVEFLIDQDLSEADLTPWKIDNETREAVELKAHRALAALLKKQPDTNQRDPWNHTPLTLAALSEDVQTARLLIEAGADVNQRGRRGMTALDIAARQGNVDLVHLLLQHHANVDSDVEGQSSDPRFSTPLHYAVDSGSLATVELLLEWKASIEARPENQYTALLMAAAIPEDMILSSLIRHGAEITAVQAYGGNALHQAASSRSLSTTEILLNHCRDLEFIDAKSNAGSSPLELALADRALDVANLLLEYGARADLADIARLLPREFLVALRRESAAFNPTTVAYSAVQKALYSLSEIAECELEQPDDAAQGGKADAHQQGLEPDAGTEDKPRYSLSEMLLEGLLPLLQKESQVDVESEEARQIDAEIRVYALAWRLVRMVLRERSEGIDDIVMFASQILEDGNDTVEEKLGDQENVSNITDGSHNQGSEGRQSPPTASAEQVESENDKIVIILNTNPDKSGRRALIRSTEPPEPELDDFWTEITDDLLVPEAITQLGYEFKRTEYFYAIMKYLTQSEIFELVKLSDQLRADQGIEIRPTTGRRRPYRYAIRSRKPIENGSFRSTREEVVGSPAAPHHEASPENPVG